MRRGLLASSAAILLSLTAGGGSGGSSVKPTGTAVWSASASLITGRGEHTATLLPNGSILVVGGTDGRGNALDSAEVYNPNTGRATPAGFMATARFGHSATLLRSGKVLVVGGMEAPFPSSTLASAELYDPTTKAWSRAARMGASRAHHTATRLLDGRVLVVGGQSFSLRNGGILENNPAAAEIYDPVANRWSDTGPMSLYRLGQATTLLRDGRVLVTGGTDGSTTFRSAEIYDSKRDRWSAAPPMTIQRYGHTATLLSNGDVLVTGGFLMIPLSSAEVYDPRVNRWSDVARMVETHEGYTATLLKSGRVLVVGGVGRSRAEVYDPVRNTWSAISPPMNRILHTATPLPDGRVVVIGGYGIESLNNVLLYDPRVVPRGPINPLAVATLVAATMIAVAAAAYSRPGVGRRLRAWRAHRESDEWITA